MGREQVRREYCRLWKRRKKQLAREAARARKSASPTMDPGEIVAQGSFYGALEDVEGVNRDGVEVSNSERGCRLSQGLKNNGLQTR